MKWQVLGEKDFTVLLYRALMLTCADLCWLLFRSTLAAFHAYICLSIWKSLETPAVLCSSCWCLQKHFMLTGRLTSLLQWGVVCSFCQQIISWPVASCMACFVACIAEHYFCLLMCTHARYKSFSPNLNVVDTLPEFHWGMSSEWQGMQPALSLEGKLPTKREKRKKGNDMSMQYMINQQQSFLARLKALHDTCHGDICTLRFHRGYACFPFCSKTL